MINVGLIGFGLSGKYLQAPFFELHPKFNLKYVSTSQELSEYNVQRLTFNEILSSDVDLISICSPNPTHYEYAKQALICGKHVLVEKPICENVLQVKELYKIAKEQNKVLAVFQNRRFDADFLTLKSILPQLGELISYEAHFDRFKPELNTKEWKEENSSTSGILFDLGSHLLDQVICLFGKPSRYFGETYIQRNNSKIDDAFFIRMNFGKLNVTLKSSLLVKTPTPRYVLHGTLGSYQKYGIDQQEVQLVSGMSPGAQNFGIDPINGTLDGKEIVNKNGNWMELFNNLADSILDNKEFIIKEDEILDQIQILNEIRNNSNY